VAESGLNGFNLKKEKIKEENFWMNDVGVGEKIESGMLTINKFKPYGLTAAMTTKELGNMSYSKGNKKLAEANFARAVGILGIRPSRTPVFVLNATHSNNIVYVKPVESVTGRNVLLRNSEHILRLHTPRGVFIPPSSMPNREKGVDAAITKNPNLYLAICAADCAVVMLFDPKTNVFGISHAGAIGLFSQIIPSTILQMANLFGANPKDILCYIPPCVKKESYRLRESNLWRSILRMLRLEKLRKKRVLRSS